MGSRTIGKQLKHLLFCLLLTFAAGSIARAACDITGADSVNTSTTYTYSAPQCSAPNAKYSWSFDTGPGLVKGRFMANGLPSDTASTRVVTVVFPTCGTAKLLLSCSQWCEADGSGVKSITIQDTSPPQFHGCLADVVSCGDKPVKLPDLCLTDNCDSPTQCWPVIYGQTTAGPFKISYERTDGKDVLDPYPFNSIVFLKVYAEDTHGNRTACNTCVHRFPCPTVNINSLKLCVGKQGTLTALVSSGRPPYVFSWDDGSSGTDLIGPNIVCANSKPFRYELSDSIPKPLGSQFHWTVSGNGAILTIDSGFEVDIQSLGVGTYTVSCELTRPNEAPQTYSKVVTIKPAGPCYQLTVDKPGTYTVFVKDANNCVCSATTVVTITPPCDISGPSPVCYSTTNQYCGPDGANLTYKWTISGNGSIIGPDNSKCVNVAAGSDAGSYTLTLQVTDTSVNCSTQCTKDVVVNKPPCGITGPAKVCYNSTNQHCGPDGAGLIYKWTVSGNGAISGPDNQKCVNVVAGASGSYTVHLAVTDPAGCVSPCDKTVTITKPPCSIDGPDPVCHDSTTQYCGPVGPGLTYKWTISGNGSIIGTSTDRCVTVKAGADAGPFHLALKVTDDIGCVSECARDINVSKPPCSIDGPDRVCYNSTNQYCGPDGTGLSYKWTISGNGAIVGADNARCVQVKAGSGAGSYVLSLTVTDGAGCSTTCAKNVTVAKPDCSIDGPSVVCYDKTAQHCGPVGATYTYKWTISGNGTIIGPDNVRCITVNAGSGAGSYVLSLEVVDTSVAARCPAQCTKEVTVNKPPCSITGPDVGCAGSTGTFCGPVGQGLTYKWAVSGGSIVGPDNQNCVTITFPGGAGSISISLIVTDSSGCSVQCTKTVTVSKPPCGITGPGSACANTPGLLYCGPDGAGLTYKWTISGDGSISGPDNAKCVTVQAGASGAFTLNLVVTDSSGCASSCEKRVPISGPLCNIDGPATLCYDVTHPFCGPVGTNYTYKWTISGNGTIIGPDNVRCITVKAGPSAISFKVTLTVTEGACSSTCEKTVNVSRPPCSITGPDPVCYNSTNQYCGPDGAALTYKWIVTGDGVIDGPDNQKCVNVKAGQSGSYTVQLTVTDAANCQSTCSKTVKIDGLPPCTITGPPDPLIFCNTPLDAQYCGPDGAGLKYEWTLKNASPNVHLVSPTNQKCVTVHVDDTTSYDWGFDLQLKTTNALGCASSTCAIHQDDPCVRLVTHPVCPNAPVQYCVPAGKDSYKWTVTGSASISGPDNLPCVTVIPGSSGTFELRLVTTLAGACTCDETSTVSILPGAPCGITGPDSPQPNQQNVQYCGPEGNGLTYKWTISGGGGSIQGPDNQRCVTVNAGPSGCFDLTLTVTTSDGCVNTCKKTVCVTPCVVEGPDPVCTGRDQIEYCTPAVTGATYKWTVSGNAMITGPDNLNCVRVKAGSPGSFTVCVRVTPPTGAFRDCCKTVTVDPLPACSIDGPAEACLGTTFQLCGPDIDGATYEWSASCPGVLTLPSDKTTRCITASASGVGTCVVTLKVTKNGCVSTCSQEIDVSELECKITGPRPVCGGAQGIEYSGPAGMDTYKWTISGDGTIDGADNQQTCKVNAGASGSFTLTLVITKGQDCRSQCTFEVELGPIDCSIVGPNPACAFSSGNSYCGPDGAGLTYKWEISGNGVIAGPADQKCCSVNAGAPGTYTLKLTVTNSQYPNCSNVCQYEVEVVEEGLLCGGLHQAYPARSIGQTTFRGYLDSSTDPITAIGGVFSFIPGENWRNFVNPVVQVYTVKDVTLIKEHGALRQCADIFPAGSIKQQGTRNIRTWWPLLYESPLTSFTLQVLYGTPTPIQLPGESQPGVVHADVWHWEMKVDFDTLDRVLDVFHEQPFGLDEVGLISDENVYHRLKELVNVARTATNNTDINHALVDMDLIVADACIGISPALPYPTGPGTGIANTRENPACCKLHADLDVLLQQYGRP